MLHNLTLQVTLLEGVLARNIQGKTERKKQVAGQIKQDM
jgi:hypothetical protein